MDVASTDDADAGSDEAGSLAAATGVTEYGRPEETSSRTSAIAHLERGIARPPVWPAVRLSDHSADQRVTPTGLRAGTRA